MGGHFIRTFDFVSTSLAELQGGKAAVSAVFSRKAAAAKISVSEDTIDQRALERQDEPAPGRIRLKRNAV
jgi:hypothetical protein